MQNLNLFISHGALQDSAARNTTPRCSPGARKKEKEKIRSWIEESNACSSVFLIQGRTGVGKTAFLQTIAEQLQAEKRQPYACFFFNRGVVGCDNIEHGPVILDSCVPTCYKHAQYARTYWASDDGGSSSSDEIRRHTIAKAHYHPFQTHPSTTSLSNTHHRRTWWMRRGGISGCFSYAHFPSIRGSLSSLSFRDSRDTSACVLRAAVLFWII